ncbi:MAG TPA: hypothetical protein VMT81_00055 [Candidatus Paceibacterota bacterium]|nr:hypothetical protein [Candidatus Paceibacterota bacterium]
MEIPQPTPPTPPPAASKQAGLISPNRIYQVQNGQNLIDPITVIGASKPEGRWRSVVLDVLAVLFAGLFGYEFSRYLASDLPFWFPLGALLLWGAVSAIEGFLQKSYSRRFLIIILESAALIGWFYADGWQALAIAWLAAIGFLLWGYHSARREMQNMIEIHFFGTSRKAIGSVVTAAVVFMIVMYAALPANNGTFFIAENGFNLFFTWGTGLVQEFYPAVPLSGSVSDFSAAIAKLELQDNPAFQNLTSAEQSTALGQASNQVMAALSDGSSTAVAVSPSEPLNNAFYQYLASLAGQLQEKFTALYYVFWGLTLFIIVRTAGVVAVWAGQFLTLIVYEILLSSGFMKISEGPATKEIIEY